MSNERNSLQPARSALKLSDTQLVLPAQRRSATIIA